VALKGANVEAVFKKLDVFSAAHARTPAS
jgi:hypothetical protein